MRKFPLVFILPIETSSFHVLKIMNTDFEMCSDGTENRDFVLWRDVLNKHLPKSTHLPESIIACLETRHA